jgi:hypothetical protein
MNESNGKTPDEILFRGKCGEWVYGYFADNPELLDGE